MAVNLINSNDITITQTGDNIQLETPNIGNLTNLTTTDKSSIVDAINEINGEIPDIYSTSEVKTNKVWIDGKPIYRKTFQFTSANNTSWNLLDSNNYEMVVNLFGEYIANEHYPFEQGFKIYWLNGNIYIQASGTFQQQRDCTVWVEYTKTN